MSNSPFTMPGSQFLGKGNQSGTPGKYASPAKDTDPHKTTDTHKAHDDDNDIDWPNEFGETQAQYIKRMEEMGLRKSDAREEIEAKVNRKASIKDREEGEGN